MDGRRVVLVAVLLVFGVRPCAADDWFAGRGWELDKDSARKATLVSTPDGLTVELKDKVESPIQIACDAPVAHHGTTPSPAKSLDLPRSAPYATPCNWRAEQY